MKKAFTLVEMMIVTVIMGLVLTLVISLFFQMQKIRTDIFAKSLIIKNSNSLMEKIGILMKNYTIDYEEYFNRRIRGCNSTIEAGDNFKWDVGTGGYCKLFTAYGNQNAVDDNNTGNNILYYCTNKDNNGTTIVEKPNQTPDCEGDSNNTGSAYIVYNSEDNLNNGSGCRENVGDSQGAGVGKVQSYGEYALQFWNVKGNADGWMGCQGDDDDTDLGIGPVAIGDNQHVKELYLISKDKTRRTFIRRKYVTEEDFNQDGTIETGEKLYVLQVLKLRGFDIGSGHNATENDKTSNDGKIDTWACDAQQGFICNGQNIGYTDYNLPANVDDGWVDLTISDLTVDKFNIEIYPTIDPNLAWSTGVVQIYPYLRINLQTSFYPTNYKTKLNPKELLKYKMNLQTTFSVKPY